MHDRKERTPNRLRNYNYSRDGYYFVTVCTKDLSEWFGRIENDKMILSKLGKIVNQCWIEIPKHFSNVQLDQFIVMPNHVHGIIIIRSIHVWGADLRPVRSINRSKMLLSKIVHGFKSSVTRQINKKNNNIYFNWKRSYYDHIIRNEFDLNRIRKYIINNPLKWELDRNHPNNL